jgi:hypothetical protein
LEPIDLARVKAILQKYIGGSGVTNAIGVTRTGDAADAGRQAATRVRANIELNQAVASGYKAFWDIKNAEPASSIYH